MEDLSEDHERAVEALQRFVALKRRQNIREVDLSFQEVKDLNLFEVRLKFIWLNAESLCRHSSRFTHAGLEMHTVFAVHVHERRGPQSAGRRRQRY